MLGIIVQARLTSSRFPNKLFATFAGKRVIDHIIDKLRQYCQDQNMRLVFALPETESNDELANYLDRKNLYYFRGKEHDVLDRFYQCASFFGLDPVIRICADRVFLDVSDITLALARFDFTKKFQEINGIAVMSFDELEQAALNSPHAAHREHVVSYMWKTIDYPSDIERLEQMLLNENVII